MAELEGMPVWASLVQEAVLDSLRDMWPVGFRPGYSAEQDYLVFRPATFRRAGEEGETVDYPRFTLDFSEVLRVFDEMPSVYFSSQEPEGLTLRGKVNGHDAYVSIFTTPWPGDQPSGVLHPDDRFEAYEESPAG
jgi:hypothetical protein